MSFGIYNTLCFIFSIGTGTLLWQRGLLNRFKGITLSTLNYVCDLYLDYKYQNFHCQSISTSVPTSVPTPVKGCDVTKIFVSGGVTYIYYRFNKDNYIFPWKSSPLSSHSSRLNWPIYDTDDLETCMKIEYESIDAGKGCLKDILKQYAGPKGNFYCDTPYKYEPRLILDDTGNPIFINDTDTLSLVTLFGTHVEFTPDQPIIIENF
jgi:hypothetical protein